ncbi:MAG: hypothetical protein DBW96_01020 [SAR86 cluster bacterium]|uniref:MoaD/ThiS family protein n=1 Tax=SAR86 cluster bacterium TaxID=2030880 RepID=A0A368BZD0_9GAMM|nr:MAG: hypothetical protein DBW96_01020 [SAR86 cluster bacterium]
MKIFLSYINNSKTHLKEFEVAEGSTVKDLLEHNEVRHLIKKQQNHDYKIGVNGEILDGKFFPKPDKYRLNEGERVEFYGPLKVDPKENRKKRSS